MCGESDRVWTTVKHTLITMALHPAGCCLLWDGGCLSWSFWVLKPLCGQSVSVRAEKTFASGIIAKRVLVAWSPAFTDPADTWELTLVILLGHGGSPGKSISFTGNTRLETPVFQTPFCWREHSWSDVWNFPFYPFICFLKCSILYIVFLSAVFTITGLPELLDKSCFTHKSEIIKGYKKDAVARWVPRWGAGLRHWEAAQPEDFPDISGNLSLSNSLPRWDGGDGGGREDACPAWPQHLPALPGREASYSHMVSHSSGTMWCGNGWAPGVSRVATVGIRALLIDSRCEVLFVLYVLCVLTLWEGCAATLTFLKQFLNQVSRIWSHWELVSEPWWSFRMCLFFTAPAVVAVRVVR